MSKVPLRWFRHSRAGAYLPPFSLTVTFAFGGSKPPPCNIDVFHQVSAYQKNDKQSRKVFVFDKDTGGACSFRLSSFVKMLVKRHSLFCKLLFYWKIAEFHMNFNKNNKKKYQKQKNTK